MKFALIATSLFAAATFTAGAASAQTVKPGLWEFKISLGKGFGKGMADIAANNKKMMGQLSAEERKEFEGGSAGNTTFTGDHMITKSCITKEEAARSEGFMPSEGGCTAQRSPAVGGVIKMNYSCTNPPSTGTSIVRMQGDTAFTMEATTVVKMNGQSFTTKGTSSGKWLAANCGDVE